MKTKPILFSTHMVQAILEGRKSQTRRIIKHKNHIEDVKKVVKCVGNEKDWGKFILTDEFGEDFLRSAKYQKGDILWVRETWKPGAWREDGRVAFDYKASPELTNTPWVQFSKFDDYFKKWTDEIIKNGSKPDVNGFHYWEAGKSPLSWKPSIFMPFEAARIFLRVTNVRCERLQDITEDDAIAEGIEKVADYGTTGYKLYTEPDAAYSDIDAIWSFESLWQSINGKDSWNENPWVWVYEFERIEKPILCDN